MNPVFEHGSLSKMQIFNSLRDLLYTPITNQMKSKLQDIILRNTLINKYSHKSFTYKNEFYSDDATPPPRIMNRLHPSLVSDMENYLKEWKALNQEEIFYVMGFISQGLNASNNLQDYLKIFPEPLHQRLRQFSNYPSYCDTHLSQQKIQMIRDKNEKAISLIKQRMVLNLLY